METPLNFGGDDHPRAIGTENFLFYGAAGSGKTLSIKLLMRTVIPLVKVAGSNVRALVYDSKPEYLSCISKMAEEKVDEKPQCNRVFNLNPLAEDCVAWDIARDIDEPVAALELASILVPDSGHESHPFFQNSARQIVYGVTLALHQLFPYAWTFRSLIAILQDLQTIRDVLEAVPYTKYISAMYLPKENDRLATDMVATIQSNLVPFEIIAACWEHAKGKISLQDWLRNQWVLVLGSSEKNRAALDAVNQLIFTRAVQLLLDKEDNEQGDTTGTTDAPPQAKSETWFFLDEIRQMGKLQKLNALLTKGRSKGACTVFGLQDIDGFSSVYGHDLVNEILGMTYNKAIFKLNSPASAKWAASLWGSYTPPADDEKSKNRQQPIMEDSQFLTIPKTNPHNSLHGYYLMSDDKWYTVAPWDSLLAAQPKEDLSRYPNFKKNENPEVQYLQRWSDEERQRVLIRAQELAEAAHEEGGASQSAPPANGQPPTGVNASGSTTNNPADLDDVRRKPSSWSMDPP